MPSPTLAPVAPPENAKSFFPKTRMLQKETITVCQMAITFAKFIEIIVKSW
jgi:hypothetical protein